MLLWLLQQVNKGLVNISLQMKILISLKIHEPLFCHNKLRIFNKELGFRNGKLKFKLPIQRLKLGS